MTDDDIDERLGELREEESTGNRLDRDDPQEQSSFVDILVGALDSAEDGDLSETVTAYDPTLAAVLQALDESDQMEDVFDQLREAYDGESGLTDESRSAIIRLAVRVGLQEGTDSVMYDLREAVEERQTTTI
ncbi:MULTISPECIES: hypothetical protein [unclassified Haloarcula]|uniref:hypothetical protein n=1 Tax=unclassified Haloarcula TaxID=2624677 RepID=UPI000679138A|nr:MULTISPECIES: hypothetical protein [unclassified Haloarcula]